MNAEAIRHFGDLAADILQLVDRDAGIALAWIVAEVCGFVARPLSVEPVGFVGFVAGAGFQFDIEARAPVGLRLLDFALSHHAIRDQALGINVEGRGMPCDFLVHHRIGERRLIAFVMSVTAIAEHVDDDRLVEFLPVFDRNLGGKHYRFRIVAVHMENRRVDHLGNIGRIWRRARIARIGREADLIVHDEV